MSDYMFGPEAGPGNPVFSHVRAAPELRTPAPGPAGTGDERSQRGSGALATLAQSPTNSGPEGVVSAGDAPDLTSSAVGGTGGGVGVHFTGNTAAPGFGAAPGTGSLAGAAKTSGPAPAQQGSRSFLEFGGDVPSSAPPNAASSNALGGPVGRI